MPQKLFGTDGIRGKVNHYPMTAELALNVGLAAAKVFTRGNGKKHRIVIGKDTRVSGYIFEYALAAGLCSMGVNVYFVGPMPTPAIALLTKSFAADAGIMISASHNPAEDNGIKFFGADGYKLPDETEHEIEQLIFTKNLAPENKTPGKAFKLDEARGRYIQFVKGSINNVSLEGMKIVLDCANGAAYQVAPWIFKELGAEVIVLNGIPDGSNINKEAGALYPQGAVQAVLREKADLGIALDGDADRVILIDEKGALVDGDELLAIMASHLKENNRLTKNTVVTTVMSNLGFFEVMKKKGINVIETEVGDRHIIEAMKKEGYILGGEQSGHIIFGEHSTTGDGTLAALQMIALMQHVKKPLSALRTVMKKYPQILLNVRVKQKKPVTELSAAKTIALIEKTLGSEGRIYVRYSGTEPLCRIMIEGKNEKEIKAYAEQIAKEIESEIGAKHA